MGGRLGKLFAGADRRSSSTRVTVNRPRHARRGARQVQPAEAARSLGVTRRTLDQRCGN